MAYLIAIICIVIVAVFWRVFASLALIVGFVLVLVAGGLFLYNKYQEATEPAQFSLSSSGIGVAPTQPYFRTFPNMAACKAELSRVHSLELAAPAPAGTTVSEHGPSEIWRESTSQREIRSVKCETKTQWSPLDTPEPAPAPKRGAFADLVPGPAYPIAATEPIPKDKVVVFVAYATDGISSGLATSTSTAPVGERPLRPPHAPPSPGASPLKRTSACA